MKALNDKIDLQKLSVFCKNQHNAVKFIKNEMIAYQAAATP
jgi:hypothetical protein